MGSTCESIPHSMQLVNSMSIRMRYKVPGVRLLRTTQGGLIGRFEKFKIPEEYTRGKYKLLHLIGAHPSHNLAGSGYHVLIHGRTVNSIPSENT